MESQQGLACSPPRAAEEGLAMDPGAAKESVSCELSCEGAYYLEQVSITDASEDDYEYEEIPDDNFSIPEGEEDLFKAVQIVQEQAADTLLVEQKTVLPPKQATPEVIEDFLCNFLIKMKMSRTLDCFQSEWYELIQKGVTELGQCGDVPDVYAQNLLLESENENLKKDLKHYKQAAEKAREELLKTQKQRDYHRMHHKRIVQEKNKLISDLKGLKLHYASYEPTIRVLHEKHNTLLKQKMLTALERDKAVGQISVLQATLRHMEIGHSYHAPNVKASSKSEKKSSSEGPIQRNIREAREQFKCRAKLKENIKKSRGSLWDQYKINSPLQTSTLSTGMERGP